MSNADPTTSPDDTRARWAAEMRDAMKAIVDAMPDASLTWAADHIVNELTYCGGDLAHRQRVYDLQQRRPG